MRLLPGGVERYRPRPTTDPAIAASQWQASFDGGLTWVNASVQTDLIPAGEPTWLLAHATVASPPVGATVMPDLEWVIPAIRFANDPELIVRAGPVVYLTD